MLLNYHFERFNKAWTIHLLIEGIPNAVFRIFVILGFLENI